MAEPRWLPPGSTTCSGVYIYKFIYYIRQIYYCALVDFQNGGNSDAHCKIWMQNCKIGSQLLKFGSVKSPWKVREKSVKRQWKTREQHRKTGSPQNLIFWQKKIWKHLKKMICGGSFLAHSGIMEAIKRAKEREARARQAIDQAGKTKNQPVPQFRHNKFTPNPCSHFFWGLLAMRLPLLRIQALALLGISSWSWDQTSVA